MGTLTSLHMGRKQDIMVALYCIISFSPKNALSAYVLLLWQDVCCCDFCRNDSIVPSQGSCLTMPHMRPISPLAIYTSLHLMLKLLNPTFSTTACSSPCLPRTAGSAKKVVPGATASLTSFIIAIKSVLSLGPHTAHYTMAPYQAQSQQVPGAFLELSGLVSCICQALHMPRGTLR